MSPNWRTPFKKLLRKSQTLLASPGKSTPSLTPSICEEKSVTTMEPENVHNFEASAVPRIFALIVAIDKYKHPNWGTLTGCKNDGNRFIDFLTGVLGVPLPQIKFLTDEQATEREIIDQFEKFLIGNADIQRDDAIVFFFAGHGWLLKPPEGWVTDSDQIEAICPYDAETLDSDGKELWGLTDRAIDKLIRRLAFAKGDNIAVVLDCCHSGGLARTVEDGLVVRSMPPPTRPPPADLNQDILGSMSEHSARAAETVIQSGFQYKAMESHVLLAACRPNENASENPFAKGAPGGLFTMALIESLRRCSLHNTSYTMLFDMLQIKHKYQHPQCEGTNKDRLLFSVNTIHDGATTFKVTEKEGRIYVSAGSIHGIVENTEFTITTQTSTQPLVLKAKKVGAFETMLDGTHRNMSNAKAHVSHWHHSTLRVHSSVQLASPHITVVPADEEAEVALRQDKSGRWELERKDQLMPVYSTRFIGFDAGVGRMSDILGAIANFNSHLYRSDGAAAGFAGKVKIRMNRIGLVHNEMNPVGDDLFNVPRSSHSGVDVKEAIITDFESRYSFTLENSSDVDLHPYFFCFDPADYSIEAWYVSTMDAPLKRRREDGPPAVFGLGYGGFGSNPVRFFLPEECESDSIFLKIFLTTTYVDMTNVAQPAIQEVHDSRGTRNNLKGTWTCETVVLTCKKG